MEHYRLDKIGIDALPARFFFDDIPVLLNGNDAESRHKVEWGNVACVRILVDDNMPLRPADYRLYPLGFAEEVGAAGCRSRRGRLSALVSSLWRCYLR